MSKAARYFSRRRGLAEFIGAGPLAPVLDDLATALEAKGHGTATVQGYVRCAGHVTYALERRHLARRELMLGGLREFARAHRDSCRCPHPERAGAVNFRGVGRVTGSNYFLAQLLAVTTRQPWSSIFATISA